MNYDPDGLAVTPEGSPLPPEETPAPEGAPPPDGAPLRELALAREADELVRSGEFRSRARAVEYLRLRTEAGLPDTDVRLRAQALHAQAQTIRALSGQDVLAAFNRDEAVKQKVLSGEWDFVDVLRHTSQGPAPVAPAPAPSGSPTGGTFAPATNAGQAPGGDITPAPSGSPAGGDPAGSTSSAPAPVRSANGAAMGRLDVASMSAAQLRRMDELLARGGVIDLR